MPSKREASGWGDTPSPPPGSRLATLADLPPPGGGEERFMSTPTSQAPAQSAIGAARGRCVAQQLMAKFSVGFAVPDLAQRLLRRLSERECVVAAHRERRDAAWQRPAVRGEIHQGPRPSAQRPRPLLLRAPQAGARLGGA